VATADKIRIGASGFSFKDWKGPFYPENIRQEKLLEFYANFFDVVEINTTYYRIPSARTFADMVRRTDSSFDFTVKLHQSMTHGREGDLQPFQDFVDAIRPLDENGRLLGLLAQFPAGFRYSEDNLSSLGWVRLKLGRFPFFAEFRHISWMRDDVMARLRELDAGWCCVDEPQLDGLLPPAADVTCRTAYVRFHGRNDIDWYHPRPGSDRYNYDYSDRELREWLPKIESLAARSEQVLLFYNNCHFGNAPNNAKKMKKLLGIPETRGARPGELPL
jgi:uncharacterized protein YecE (DUF72 family)